MTENVEIVDAFEDFIHQYYRDEIGDLARRYPNDQESLYIDAKDLYRFDPDLLDDWQSKPEKMNEYAEAALRNYDLPIDRDLSDAHVRLTDKHGYLDDFAVSEISTEQINDYIAVQGHLSRITDRNPRVEVAAFECQKCGVHTHVPQTRVEFKEPHECTSCERQGPFHVNMDKSVLVDQRKIKLEEPIEERSQARGQSLPVYTEHDLVDYAPGNSTLPEHAGEHATIIGIVRVDKSQWSGRNASPETEIWIEAKAIVFDGDDEHDIDIEAHREKFEEHAGKENAVELVATSIAPNLYSEEGDDLHAIRKACAAWLFNAYRANPEGAGSKRGDMHMGIIGDPGTGKSTLMSYLDDVCPKSEYRSGTGLTEAGLTSAAVQEEFAGTTEWTLEPGILPRADGGHCIIDEIDGVLDEDTKAIHDALEGEQKVKADKAGIQADLPSRTALLVGGNPTYTRFDKNEDLTEQIDLDPALFDRLDLLFALEDQVDGEKDAAKGGHVLDSWDDLTRAEVDNAAADGGKTTDAPVEMETLRAWIAHARDEVHPTLTEEVKEMLNDFYVEVRNLNNGHESAEGGAVPATPRTLEAAVRASIAYARLRLSDVVEPEDAQRAIALTKEFVGLRFDPETGKFDDARTGRGTTESQDKRLTALKQIVAELEPSDDVDGGVEVEEIVPKATDDLDITESKVEEDVEKMKTKGIIYEPKTDQYRTT